MWILILMIKGVVTKYGWECEYWCGYGCKHVYFLHKTVDARVLTVIHYVYVQWGGDTESNPYI